MSTNKVLSGDRQKKNRNREIIYLMSTGEVWEKVRKAYFCVIISICSIVILGVAGNVVNGYVFLIGSSDILRVAGNVVTGYVFLRNG